MSFDKIISIPGMSGLFKMVAQMRNSGFIVEGLSDNKRIPVSAMQRIVMLKDVAIYTNGDDVPLYDVFKKMKDQHDFCLSISNKADGSELKAALKKVFPDYDDTRVHTSDIKKMFVWYQLIAELIGTPESEEIMNPKDETSNTEAKSSDVVEEPAAEKKKVTRKKKTDSEEEAPAAKAPAKKAKKTSTKSE